MLVRPDGPASEVTTDELNLSFAPCPDYAGIAKAAGHGKLGAFTASTADDLKERLAKAVEMVKAGTSAVLDAQLEGSQGKYSGR